MIIIGHEHTLELVLADIDESWWVDHVGGEVIDHLGNSARRERDRGQRN
jgi:hypothetical protein